MRVTLDRAAAWLKHLLVGYAQIYFSVNPVVGALFLAATFIVPEQGLAGLVGLIAANAVAQFLGMPRHQIDEGYYAFNGLLIGLALGLTYRVSSGFIVMLGFASVLGVLTASAVRTVFERYIGTPPLSLAFVLTTWVAITAGRQLSDLMLTLEPYEVTVLQGSLPYSAEFVVTSLGAALFQLNVPAGILIALGILIFSRHAFILGIAGIGVGSLLYIFLGGRPEDLALSRPGFNYALTAIALGGVRTVPGPWSFLLGTVGAGLCAVISCACAVVLAPLGLPPLAFPFVATVTVVLFALKQRERTNGLELTDIPEKTPEANLTRARNLSSRSLASARPVFALPFHGEWTVTQAFHGPHTHKGLWAHAWDFEVLGADGNLFKTTGAVPADFFAYNLPVLAPADGRVVRVVSHVHDNSIGHINAEANWGNLVIMRHTGGVYSALCHLLENSVSVSEGDYVKTGDIVGRVGSSGRSPRPHLHFQAQIGPEIGAPTVPADLAGYIVNDAAGMRYVTRGEPREGDAIRSMIPDATRFDAGSFPLGRSWRFHVRYGGREVEEMWESETDFLGARYLVCRSTGASLRIYVDRTCFIAVDYDGSPTAGLSWLMAALPRIPFTTADVQWSDRLPARLLMSCPRRIVHDLLEPFISTARVESSSRFVSVTSDGFQIETVIHPCGPLLSSMPEIVFHTSFDLREGLSSIIGTQSGEVFLEMHRIPSTDVAVVDPTVAADRPPNPVTLHAVGSNIEPEPDSESEQRALPN